MNRGSFLKGLFGGAITLAAIPTSANIVRKETNVKKLTDEQLNELYNAYIDLQTKNKLKEDKAKKLHNNSILEIRKQYDILPSITFIFNAFHKRKSTNISNINIKKHIKKLENYLNWLDKYFYENRNKWYTGKNRGLRDMEYIFKVDVVIAIIKGYLLIGSVKTADELFYKFVNDRNGGIRDRFIDDYALIYFGDLYFKAGFRKESIEWYNESSKDRIVRWCKKLEQNPNDKEVINEFNKRYHSSSYFGYMIYDRDNIYTKSCDRYKLLNKEYKRIENGKFTFDINEWFGMI